MTRIGASQVFFNIVAQFNAEKLIKDYRSINTVMKAVSLDTFEAILKPVEGLAQGINKITDELKPLQEELGLASVEFEKFFGTVQDMEAMRDSLMELGEAFAQTGVEALAAGSRAAQVANLVGRGNVEVLTKLAYTLAEISDLNAEEAQRGIIQLHQQTGMLFGELNQESFRRLSLQQQQNILVEEGAKALDALNTIANRSVALEGDLVRVMGTFAAQGELVGDSFEFMAAASATLLEAGEEQGTAGRALRMMYARLGGDISGARTQIERLGFELTDSEGNMKTMQEVLTELSEKGWSGFSGAQKQNIAQTIAGNRHYVRFIKLMENYDRTMQLAEDGAMGFDSALGQANKALETQVNLLRKAEIRNENLRAKIGEGLNPFMRGQVEVQNDYLAVTEALTDGFGNLGAVLGRLKGTMEVMGGFIKIGLATQSFGIGLEMFTSVQRQLHDIQVANEHLHSKQANYGEFGVRQTKTQRDLMSHVQYIQQRINMHAQERRTAQQVIAFALADEKEQLEKITALEEKENGYISKKANLLAKIRRAKEMEAVLNDKNSTYAERTAARITYNLATEGTMLADVEALYSQKTATQDAMMSQYLSDLDVAKRLTDDEITLIHERHGLLREERMLLQRLKSDNENRYRARGGGYDGDPAKEYQAMGLDMFEQSGLILSPREEKILMNKLRSTGQQGASAFTEAFKKRADKTQTKRQFMLDSSDEAMFSNYADHLALTKFEMDGLGGSVEYTSYQHDLFTRAMKDTQGQFIQSDKAINTLNAAYKDHTMNGRAVASSKNALNRVNHLLTLTERELNVEMEKDKQLKIQLQPLMDKVNQELGEEAAMKEKLLYVTKHYNTELKNMPPLLKSVIQNDKESIELSEKRVMVTRQLGFATNNLLGLMSGVAGGTLGASMSMAFMASNILGAAKAAGVSATALFALNKKQLESTFSANSNYVAQSRLSKGIMKVGKASYATAGALSAMVAAAAPFAVIGGAIYAVQLNAKDAKDKMDALNETMLETENSIGLLKADSTTLEDGILAKTLGIDNRSTAELVNNIDVIDDNIRILTESQGKFNDTQNLQIDGAIRYLGILKSTIDETNKFVDKAKFDELSATTADDLMGAFSITNWAKQNFGGAKDKDMEMLGTVLGINMQTGFEGRFDMSNIRDNLDELLDYMGEGNKLSKNQLELAQEAFNDKEIAAYLGELNRLIYSEKEREYYLNAINEETKETATATAGAADEIKNLTDEIYNFSGAREELFFGGKYGNVTGSLYRTVVKQGVGTLYNKSEVIMTNNFHGFFNEREAAARITDIVTEVLATQ